MNVGMARTRFETRGWMSPVRSRDSAMMASDVRKAASSSIMAVWLVMLMPIPYCCVVTGQNSWNGPPNKKSPIRACDARAIR